MQWSPNDDVNATLKNTQTTKELKEIEVWNHRPLNPLLNVYFEFKLEPWFVTQKNPLKRPSSVLVDESEIKQIPKAYWDIFCARHISWHTTKKRVLQNFGLTHTTFFI